MNTASKWIWYRENGNVRDTHGDFFDTFEYNGGKAFIEISADSNYEITVNGKFVNAGQYPDFPWYKVYDRIDITEFCKKGENTLAVSVWYYGIVNQSYYIGNAGLRYEVYEDEKTVAFSSEKTLSRLSVEYKSEYNKRLAGLGDSYLYDMNKNDGWREGKLTGFHKSYLVDQDLPMYLRPIPKFRIDDRAESVFVKSENDNRYLYDLGAETVGYLTFDVETEEPQKILVAYGEHIREGWVERIQSNHDYSFEIILKKGRNVFSNYFKRLGLRYLEIQTEKPLKINYASVFPTEYPVKRKPFKISNPRRQQIYDVAVRTLELCMHDHYEDCPWREQGLYALDSRNQILCGFEAFGEEAFPRANLLLMSKDDREDGLLALTTPYAGDLTIPMFSLVYFLEIDEYTQYTGDITLAREVYPKLKSVINVFINHLKGDWMPIFLEKKHWNYYHDDPTKRMEDIIGCEKTERFDAALNLMFIMALMAMQNIANKIGEEDIYGEIIDRVRAKVIKEFYVPETGVFKNNNINDDYSVLVNAFAILSDSATPEQAKHIAEVISDDSNTEIIKPTISVHCYEYDALLKVDEEKYKDYILKDIDKFYGMMLDAGATSFWETERGYPGSLCHAWSSMPVYYYHKFGMNEV